MIAVASCGARATATAPPAGVATRRVSRSARSGVPGTDPPSGRCLRGSRPKTIRPGLVAVSARFGFRAYTDAAPRGAASGLWLCPVFRSSASRPLREGEAQVGSALADLLLSLIGELDSVNSRRLRTA